MGFNGIIIRLMEYTLWLCQQFAIENGHRNSWFTHKKWWFSIVVLVYQRVSSHNVAISLDEVGMFMVPKLVLLRCWSRGCSDIQLDGSGSNSSSQPHLGALVKSWGPGELHGTADVGHVYYPISEVQGEVPPVMCFWFISPMNTRVISSP